MHVDLFAYGTIRTDVRWLAKHGWSPEDAQADSALDIQFHWDPNAEVIGDLGGWVLHDRALHCSGPGHVPAVTDHDVTGAQVIGDLYRVTLDGFQAILRYEGYPSLYRFETVWVNSLTTPSTIEQAVVFTTNGAHSFGPAVPSGDYYNQEVPCAEPIRG